MSILIRGVSLPPDDKMDLVLCIRHDGTVLNPWGTALGKAIELPPHGRLGDLDALGKVMGEGIAPSVKDGGFKHPFDIIRAVANAPTIIPADGGDAQ